MEIPEVVDVQVVHEVSVEEQLVDGLLEHTLRLGEVPWHREERRREQLAVRAVLRHNVRQDHPATCTAQVHEYYTSTYTTTLKYCTSNYISSGLLATDGEISLSSKQLIRSNKCNM